MTSKEWLDVLASMDNPAMSAIGQGLVDSCATMTKERDALTNDGRGLRSRTYGELPESVAALIVGHEWDNMPVSDQRDWAVDVVAARDQEIKTLREERDAWKDERSRWSSSEKTLGKNLDYWKNRAGDQEDANRANTRLISDLRAAVKRLEAGWNAVTRYWEDVEARSADAHTVYQREAHRRGDVRHPDAYESLSEPTKEWDRVLVRWVRDALKLGAPIPAPPYVCPGYVRTGILENRGGTVSDFCQECGEPRGYHPDAVPAPSSEKK